MDNIKTDKTCHTRIVLFALALCSLCSEQSRAEVIVRKPLSSAGIPRRGPLAIFLG